MKKKNLLTIYVYNSVEDEWPYISGISDKKEREKNIYSSNKYSECFLFTNIDKKDFIFVSPIQISDNFKKYFKSFTHSSFEVVVPKQSSEFICQNIIHDARLFKALVKKAKLYKYIQLSAYAATPQLYLLKKEFIKNGVSVKIPEAPSETNRWTVSYLGSKSGLRELLEKNNIPKEYIKMPKGIVCHNIKTAVETALDIYHRYSGVVIKTDKGSAGNGLLIYRKGDLPLNETRLKKKLISIMCKNSFWAKHPIIIEHYIKINFRDITSFPNIEYKINQNGEIEMLYYCVMNVTPEGEYYGMEMNKHVVNKVFGSRLIRIGDYVAHLYKKLGYVGHFDIDMITVNNQIYISESNTRQTGGTDAYKIARYLIGKDFFSRTYVISRCVDLVFKKQYSFNKITEKLKPVLYNHRKKEGVIVGSALLIKHKSLAYIILAKNKKQAYGFEEKMKKMLSGH